MRRKVERIWRIYRVTCEGRESKSHTVYHSWYWDYAEKVCLLKWRGRFCWRSGYIIRFVWSWEKRFQTRIAILYNSCKHSKRRSRNGWVWKLQRCQDVQVVLLEKEEECGFSIICYVWIIEDGIIYSVRCVYARLLTSWYFSHISLVGFSSARELYGIHEEMNVITCLEVVRDTSTVCFCVGWDWNWRVK